jgi:glycerophosphoryl diester phosphodiesterase
MKDCPMIVAHRGGGGLWPENSPTAFHNVIELPVDGVEFDVHRTKDGVAVVIHDAVLGRTSGGTGHVGDHTRAQLESITLKRTSADSIPTLEQVLEILRPARLQLRVEIKNDDNDLPYPGIEETVLHLLGEHDMLDRTTIIAFDWTILASLRKLNGTVRLGGNLRARGLIEIGGIDRAVELLREQGVDELSPNYRLISPDSLAGIRARGLGVGVWTVNDRSALRSWLSSDADSVTTDRPDSAIRVRDRLALSME